MKPRQVLAILLLVLLCGTLMPGSVKSEIEAGLWKPLPWAALAHFALFAAMAALPVYGSGPGAWVRALLLALLLAIATELMQAWVPGRHPLVRDFFIDLAGACAGLSLRALWRRAAPAKLA